MSRLCLTLCLLLAALGMGRAATIALQGGGRMYYEVSGPADGEVVVLLHGHSLDRRMWEPQVGVLSQRYRVVCPDLRGYGLSSDPADGLQFTYADDVVALLDSLGVARAHVVGLSMGGYVAGDLLALQPGRLLTCMMVSGDIIDRPGPSEPKSAREVAAQRRDIERVRQQGLPAYKRRRIDRLVACAAPGRGEALRPALARMIGDWRAWQALHVTARVYYGREAMSRLRERPPRVPFLIVWGEADRPVPSPMPALAPGYGRELIVPDCGHMVNMERPGLFNSILLRWLGSQTVDAPGATPARQ